MEADASLNRLHLPSLVVHSHTRASGLAYIHERSGSGDAAGQHGIENHPVIDRAICAGKVKLCDMWPFCPNPCLSPRRVSSHDAEELCACVASFESRMHRDQSFALLGRMAIGRSNANVVGAVFRPMSRARNSSHNLCDEGERQALGSGAPSCILRCISCRSPPDEICLKPLGTNRTPWGVRGPSRHPLSCFCYPQMGA